MSKIAADAALTTAAADVPKVDLYRGKSDLDDMMSFQSKVPEVQRKRIVKRQSLVSKFSKQQSNK